MLVTAVQTETQLFCSYLGQAEKYIAFTEVIFTSGILYKQIAL